jgi:chromosome segregation ATPase
MSDIDGRDAFDNVVDRLIDKTETAARYLRERDEARLELSNTQRRMQQLERELADAQRRPRPPVPATDPDDPGF